MPRMLLANANGHWCARRCEVLASFCLLLIFFCSNHVNNGCTAHCAVCLVCAVCSLCVVCARCALCSVCGVKCIMYSTLCIMCSVLCAVCSVWSVQAVPLFIISNFPSTWLSLQLQGGDQRGLLNIKIMGGGWVMSCRKQNKILLLKIL